ncbi:MAG TPA: hypothetical protein PLA50_20000, partial [Bacteroidia bacterium]|nr:hypothetical protein [Bacteroidia bacterium]
MSLRKANRLAFGLIQEKVLTLVVSTAPRIDGDKVARLVDPAQDGSPLYEEVAAPLREVHWANNTGALPIRFLYLVRPLPDGGGWEYVVDTETDAASKSHLGDKVEFHNPSEIPTFGESWVDGEYARDSFGTWLSAFAPVTNSAGETVAMLGADIAAQRIELLLRKLLVGDLVAMMIALTLAAALAAWLSAKVSRP